MCDIEEMSVNEAAAVLGRRPDTVKHQLARIHRRLRAILCAQGDTELELRSCVIAPRLTVEEALDSEAGHLSGH